MITKFLSFFTCNTAVSPDSLAIQDLIDKYTRSFNKKYEAFWNILEHTEKLGYFPKDVTLSPKDMLTNLGHYRNVILTTKSIDIAPWHKYFGEYPISIKMDMIIHANQTEQLNHSLDENGSTFVHHAVKLKNLPMLKCLLETGSDPNVQDDFGNTALFYCCGKLHKDGETVKMLLKYGADPMITNKQGQTFEARARVKRNFTNLRLLSEDHST